MEISEQLIKKAAKDLVNSTYCVALTGAGISTESGIPDFRGPSGVWTKNPEAEKRAFRSYEMFLEDPKMWWEERLNSSNSLGDLTKAAPNPGHYSLVALEEMDILKCVITQNVDALHERAGTKNLLEYHGSVLKLRCISCGTRFRRDEVDLEKLRRENLLPPHCPRCGGIIKTDGVAFGEPIPRDVANRSLEEVLKCDLMLICGTSAVVYPFAGLPRAVKQKKAHTVTIVEINAEPTPLTYEGISNYLIQGKTGEILPRIVEEIKK
ncbi:MAG: NAD-dependent deacylase [Candidatus Bathyarchaeota archaeon]